MALDEILQVYKIDAAAQPHTLPVQHIPINTWLMSVKVE